MTLTNAGSILFYILFFTVVSICAYLGFYKKKRAFAVLAIALPVLVAAFRFNVGTDYAAYYKMYDEVAGEPFNIVFRRIQSGSSEPFAILLILLCKNVLFGHWLYFAIFSLITILFLYLAFHKFDTKNSWLLYTAALLILFPLSLNAMRQIAAVAIVNYVLTSIIFDKKKIYWKYILLTVFAMTIHYSTLLFMPVLFVPLIIQKIKYKKFCIFVLIMLGVALMILPGLMSLLIDNNLLPEKYVSTLDEYGSATLSFDLLIIFIVAIMLFMTRMHFNRYDKRTNQVILTMMVCGIFYAGLGFFSAYIGRMADFFWPMNIISLWLVVDRFKDKPITKIIIFLLIPILYAISSYIIMGNNEIIPYQILL